jgi:hypothetical protein
MSDVLLTMAAEFVAMSDEEIDSAAMSELFVAMLLEFTIIDELLLLIETALAPIAVVFTAILDELVAAS